MLYAACAFVAYLITVIQCINYSQKIKYSKSRLECTLIKIVCKVEEVYAPGLLTDLIQYSRSELFMTVVSASIFKIFLLITCSYTFEWY